MGRWIPAARRPLSRRPRHSAGIPGTTPSSRSPSSGPAVDIRYDSGNAQSTSHCLPPARCFVTTRGRTWCVTMPSGAPAITDAVASSIWNGLKRATRNVTLASVHGFVDIDHTRVSRHHGVGAAPVTKPNTEYDAATRVFAGVAFDLVGALEIQRLPSGIPAEVHSPTLARDAAESARGRAVLPFRTDFISQQRGRLRDSRRIGPPICRRMRRAVGSVWSVGIRSR